MSGPSARPAAQDPSIYLPFEIISRIFVDFCSHEWVSEASDGSSFTWCTRRPDQSREMVLTRVSRRWRDIALRTPLLWSNPVIRLFRNFERMWPEQLKTLKIYVDKSQRLPLDVTFWTSAVAKKGGSGWRTQYNTEAMDLLRDHQARVRSLYIFTRDNEVYHIWTPLLEQSSLPALTGCTIHAHDFPGSRGYRLGRIAVSNALRTFSLTFGRPFWGAPGMPADTLRAVLNDVRLSLTELTLGVAVYTPRMNNPPSAPAGPILLDNLHVLTLVHDLSVLWYIDCRSLKHLRVSKLKPGTSHDALLRALRLGQTNNPACALSNAKLESLFLHVDGGSACSYNWEDVLARLGRPSSACILPVGSWPQTRSADLSLPFEPALEHGLPSLHTLTLRIEYGPVDGWSSPGSLESKIAKAMDALGYTRPVAPLAVLQCIAELCGPSLEMHLEVFAIDDTENFELDVGVAL